MGQADRQLTTLKKLAFAFSLTPEDKKSQHEEDPAKKQAWWDE
jgi:hypothetical protein